MNFKVLNKKQSNKILDQIKEQFQIKKIDLNQGFIQRKEKIYIVTKDLSKIDYENIKFNNIGLYFCKMEKDGIRLSIEGAQLVGKEAKKSILLDEEETRKWFSGEFIGKSGSGYVIVKNKKDILGCGKLKNDTLYNYVPKERRISII